MTVTLALREQITIDGTGLFNLGLVAKPVSGLDEIPPVRGDDAPYTGLDGAQYLRKLRDGSTFVLHIYALGTDSDGLVSTTNRRHARANLDTLYTLLAARNQRTVSRVMPDGSTRSCLAEVVRVERAPDPTGGSLFSLVATFRNAEGKWFGVDSTDSNRPIGATVVQFNLQIGGTIETYRARFTFTGPFVTPRLTNQTTGAFFEAAGVTVTTGSPFIVDAYTFSTTNGGVDVSGSISHGGAVPFMVLNPGANSMTVSSQTAGGTLTSVVSPAYY